MNACIAQDVTLSSETAGIVKGAFAQAGNTVGPVAMLIVGMLLADITPEVLRGYRQIWKPVLLRLVVLPVILLDYTPMSGYQLAMLLLAGLAAAGGQFSITAAYSNAPAREISVYDYTQVIFAALLGFIFFSQIPDVWSVIGYVIICGVSVIMYRYNQRAVE